MAKKLPLKKILIGAAVAGAGFYAYKNRSNLAALLGKPMPAAAAKQTNTMAIASTPVEALYQQSQAAWRNRDKVLSEQLYQQFVAQTTKASRAAVTAKFGPRG